MTPLDRALRARFLTLSVRADRSAWLAWAQPGPRPLSRIRLAEVADRTITDATAPPPREAG